MSQRYLWVQPKTHPLPSMNITLFAQIIRSISRSSFDRIVAEKQTDKHNKGFSSWNHFVAMIFCQMAKATSVRDISNGLRSATGNLNHLGVSAAPSKSTISYQNKHRDHSLFKDMYFQLLQQLSSHCGVKPRRFRIKSKILLLDSTLISLCLSVFDWARYRTHKGAVKLHTLLDYQGGLPHFVHISDGKMGDNTATQHIPIPKASVVVADRYYADFSVLNNWDSNGAFFVVRHKRGLSFTTIQERELPQDKNHHILKDEIISLDGVQTKKKYTKTLRRVAIWDEVNLATIELLTNQMSWTAYTISELYKARWDIEIFFRELKNVLHIKTFVGTSENAVMIQIWTALISILLLKYLKAKAQYGWHLSNLLAFIRMNIFVKIDLQKWLDAPFKDPPETSTQPAVQGSLF